MAPHEASQIEMPNIKDRLQKRIFNNMSATLLSMEDPVPEVPDVEMTEQEPQLFPLPELETVSVLEPAPPPYPHYIPSPLMTKYKKKWMRLLTKASNAVILKDKLKRHVKWLKHVRKTRARLESKRHIYPTLPVRYVCGNCGQGPYARDDDAPDDAAQEEAKKNNLMCERPLAYLNAWSFDTKMTRKQFTLWWRKARENVKIHLMEQFENEMKHLQIGSAFQAWKSKENFIPPTIAKLFCSRSAIGTLDCTRAMPASMAAEQTCGEYICKRCSGILGLDNNLDEDCPSYCPKCYKEGTADDDREREEQNALREASKKYKDARPNRGLEPTNKLPKPSTLVTDRSANKWWGGSEAVGACKLIKELPARDGQYSDRELDVFLKAILNTVMNKFSGLQEPYTLVANDNPKHSTLDVKECQHHFGDEGVDIVQKSGYTIWEDKFIINSQVHDMDPFAEPDDSDEGDRDLKD